MSHPTSPDGEAEARAMTDQPAAPTPGPYEYHNTSINKHFWLISAAMPTQRKSAISGSRIRVAEIKHWGDKEPGESEANAELLAASWATAAERDRLSKALNDIAKGIVPAKEMPSLEQEPLQFQAQMWAWSQRRARAALDEARACDR